VDREVSGSSLILSPSPPPSIEGGQGGGAWEWGAVSPALPWMAGQTPASLGTVATSVSLVLWQLEMGGGQEATLQACLCGESGCWGQESRAQGRTCVTSAERLASQLRGLSKFMSGRFSQESQEGGPHSTERPWR
jgi:hypothetical protein